MAPKTDLLHARFRAAVAEELKRRDLATWMRTHRAEMAAMLKGGKMNRGAAAEHFTRAGLRDAEGRRLTAASAEAAWIKVRRARQ